MCTAPGPTYPRPGTVTAYLDVTAAADSAGTTPVSVTVGAPGTESVTVTGTSGVAASGYAASFADSGHLAVTEVGAPLLSCPAQAKGCAEALARTATGNALNNDSWAMVGLDDDADKATRTSSSTGARAAGRRDRHLGRSLLVGQRAGRGEHRLPGAHPAVRAGRDGATPRSSPTGSRPVPAPAAGRRTRPSPTSPPRSQPGVPARGGLRTPSPSPGLARYAGWSLVVVYSDDSVPVGRVSVVDGFTSVAPGTDVELTLPGTAGLNARVGLVAWEGDAGIDGDILRLDGAALTPELGDQAENNVADSSALGARFLNTLGVDAKPLTGAVFAGDTAKLRAFTRQDVFLLGVLTVSSTR